MDINTIKDNFLKNGFEFSYFDDKESALQYLDDNINGQIIGFGGSVTIEQISLMPILEKHNNILYRFNNENGKTPDDIMKEQLTSDVYISSANAVTENGEIVNIDGRCNRISAINYGHKKVYIIIGKNKICKNLEDAIFRAKNIAAPLNAKRLNKNTPCAIYADKCYDCDSPERICRAMTIIYRKPSGCDFEIILINEDLGY